MIYRMSQQLSRVYKPYLKNLHRSYGCYVGENFPLWVCVSAALAATSAVFLLLGKKQEWDPSLDKKEKVFSLVSWTLGCLSGGATLVWVSLPAWGQGHRGFQEGYQPKLWYLWTSILFTPPSFFCWIAPYFASLGMPRTSITSLRLEHGRYGVAVRALELAVRPILSGLDLLVGACALPLFLVTLGRHVGSRRVARTSYDSFRVSTYLNISHARMLVYHLMGRSYDMDP